MKYSYLFLSLLFILVGLESALCASPFKTSIGWSLLPDTRLATAESLNKLKKEVKHPKLVILYLTDQHNPQTVLAMIKSSFPKAKIFGHHSLQAVFSSDGLHYSKAGSMAMMAIEGDDLSVGVAGDNILSGKGDLDSIVAEAKRDGGMTKPIDPALILMSTTSFSMERDFVKDMSKFFPSKLPLMGGTSCNNKLQPGNVFVNGKVLTNGVGLALLFTKKKIGSYFHFGMVEGKVRGKITKMKGGDIAEIDGQPALNVYKKWSGDFFATRTDTLRASIYRPLAKEVLFVDGVRRFLTIHILKFNSDRSLTPALSMHVGDNLYFTEATSETYLERVDTIARKAMINGDFDHSQISGGLHIFCGGAAMGLGLPTENAHLEKMVYKIRDAVYGKPFIGAFTCGEHGNIVDYGFAQGNLMSSMVVF